MTSISGIVCEMLISTGSEGPVPWLRLFSLVFSNFGNQVTSPLNCVDISKRTPL